LKLNIPLTGGANFRAAADVYEAGVPIEFATDAINALPRNKKGVPVGANGRKIYRFEYIKTTILNKWNEEQETNRQVQESVEYYLPENIKKRRDALISGGGL